MTEIKYIKLAHDLTFPDVAGRYTTLMKGVHGLLLSEAIIDKLIDITQKQKEKCLKLLQRARKELRFLALVGGYPCILRQNDFQRSEAPVISIVPGEIIGGGYDFET